MGILKGWKVFAADSSPSAERLMRERLDSHAADPTRNEHSVIILGWAAGPGPVGGGGERNRTRALRSAEKLFPQATMGGKSLKGSPPLRV